MALEALDLLTSREVAVCEEINGIIDPHLQKSGWSVGSPLPEKGYDIKVLAGLFHRGQFTLKS